MHVEPRAQHQPLVPPGGVDHHVRDMTATFSADVTLAVAQARLAEHGQWLPVDGDPALSLGQLVETNSTGPLRLGYGAWRDLLLGCQFTNRRGDLITAGGRTVKNVAGYDLTKFMVGQHGLFGTVRSVTTRTYRRPAGSVRARFEFDEKSLLELLPTPCRPHWAMMFRGELFCGYLDDEPALAFYERSLAERGAAGITRDTLDADIGFRAERWLPGRPGTRFRAAVPPVRVRDFLAVVEDDSAAADPAFGIVVGSCDLERSGETLRRKAVELGGSVRFDDPRSLRGELDAGLPTGRLLRRLYDAFGGSQSELES